jgi:wyosine [tRNA(Phe)-imidazoG37] synthetase (radical SAM superfamily)
MSDLPHHVRDPGDGADRPLDAPAPLRYVYVARSRRSGGLSLGVDLTPQGYCSFRCVYCQASHPPLVDPDLTVDTDRLYDELLRKLQSPEARDLRDLVVAGSGEPTCVPNAPDALDAVRRACDTAAFDRPRRIFTNARHLSQPRVFDALVSWVQQGGELWVKLDGVTDASVEAINGRQFDVTRHLDNIWRLARACPIGLQTMLLRGPSTPDPVRTVPQIARTIADAVRDGARIHHVHVITISRVPSDPHNAAVLDPIEADELAAFGRVIARATDLPVDTYPAR